MASGPQAAFTRDRAWFTSAPLNVWYCKGYLLQLAELALLKSNHLERSQRGVRLDLPE